METIFLDFKLFEEYPLYRKLHIKLPKHYGGPPDPHRQSLTFPAIHLICPVCKSENTFVVRSVDLGIRQKDQLPGYQQDPYFIGGKSAFVPYACSSCKDYHQFYFLYFDIDLSYVMKIGQYPAWSVAVEKNLAGVLGAYENMYHKGLICESQGYGIGAYAYYRRIVENIIDKLLDLISDLLEENEETAAYKEAHQKAKISTIAKDKITLVKDLLPSSLRPDNMNPLGILHDTLSVGIHTKTDEECLDLAGHIRETLVYLVKRINLAREEKESSRSFTTSMRKLLDKKKEQR